MIKNKELIKKRFSRSLKTYSGNAVIQKQMAKKLVGEIPGFNFEKILELGCGTGFITEELVSKINFSDYITVDIIPECKNYISKISDKIRFICEDIEDNNKIYSSKYDLIISNATLQWLDNLPQFIQKLKNNLTDTGYLIFTLFGKENYKELAPFVKNPLKYYSVDEIKNFCTDYEIINISEEKFVMEFKTPTYVLRHIKNTGVNALSEAHWTRKDLINFEKEYSKEITLTYHPIYIILKQS
jgi:malonyl-CoA O-methyltransferase